MSALRRAGQCHLCGRRIEAGQEVDWEQAAGKNVFIHPNRACPNSPTSATSYPMAAGPSAYAPPATTPSPVVGVTYERREPISVSVERTVADELGSRTVRFQARESGNPESAQALAETFAGKADAFLREWALRAEEGTSHLEPRTGVERERERLAEVRRQAGART